MSRREGTLKLSSNIEPRASAPLDARLVVPTLADLTASGAFPYPYVGMIVSVQSEGKAYMLTASDPTVSANWTEIGSGGGESIQVTTLPTASIDELGNIYQYVGVTTSTLTHNYFYECKEVADSDPTEYEWVRTNAQLEEKYLEVVYSLPSPSPALIGKQYYMAGETPSTIKGHVYECNSTGSDWIDITPMDKYKSISQLTMTGAKYQCITGLKVNRTYLVETGYSIYLVKVITNLGDQSQPKYGFEIELLGQNLNDTTNSFYNYPVYLNNYQDNAENPILAVYVSNDTRTLISVTQISGTSDNDFDFGTFYTSTPPAPFKKSMFYSAASMREAIAPLFNSSKSYNVGDIVWKRVNTSMYSSYPCDNIELYRCTTAHSGDWSASHFEKIQLCKDFKSGSKIFTGTMEEWEALTEAEQAEYDFIASPEEDGSETNKFFYQTGIVTINTTVGQTTVENIELPNPMPDNEYCVDVQITGGFPEACILNAMHTSVNGFRIYAYNTGAADYAQTVRWQVYRIPH